MFTDARVRVPPNYDAFQRPDRGASFADPVFGTGIKRISSAGATTNADGSGGDALTWITDEYSSVCPFSNDNSRLILVHESYFGLYSGAGVFLRSLPLEINASARPRWSRKDSLRTLYYIKGNQLKSFNVDSGVASVVHTFTEYTTIDDGGGKSDISLDGDHFVFCGDNRFVFVYELSTGLKYRPWENTTGLTFHNLYLTPHNNFSLAWWDHGTTPNTGIDLFDINGHYIRQLVHADGHMDYMLDSDGSEVLIWFNSDDPVPVPDAQNAVVKVKLSDGSQTPLLELDWSQVVHVSTPDAGGFCYVSTYTPSNPAPAQWQPYTNELLKVPIDGSPAQRLAHHRSRPNATNTYNYQAHISCSRDGSRFVFNSNFNLRPTPNYSDVYMVQVGNNPHPPVPPRPPRPHPPIPPIPQPRPRI